MKSPSLFRSKFSFFAGQDSHSESVRVAWQLLQGFLIGAYLAAFNVGATALFLDHFDEKNNMPVAIIVSGVLGVILTYLFTYFQSRVSFIRLAQITLAFITAITAFFWIDLQFTNQNTDTVIFFAFVCMTPFSSLLLLIFWGIFGTLFTLRESKRIIGRIDTGQQAASLISLVAIPVSLPLFNNNNSSLFAISAISTSLLLIVLFIISQRYKLDSHTEHITEENKSRSLFSILNNRYILLLSAFVLVSMIVVSFVNYSFNIVTAEQYSGANLATFLSIFSAIIVIVGFLVQTFVTDKLVDTYGLKVALLINPLLTLFFTLMAFLTGTFLGYTKATKAFLFFSLSIALSQLIVRSLKDALDSPSFKLYFLPLDKSIRLNVQSGVEGVVTAGASLIAGALLFIINYVKIFDLIHVTIFLIPIIALWFFSALQMHRQYRSTLENTLKSIKSGKEEINDIENQQDSFQEHQFGAVYDILVIDKLDALLQKAEMMEQTRKNSSEMRDYGMLRLSQDIMYTPANGSVNKAQRRKAVDATQVQDDKEFTNINLGRLDRFARSKVAMERVYAAKMLSKAANDTNIDILILLMRDKNEEVRSAAIHTARKVQHPETWSLLINELNSYKNRNEAIAALIEAGEKVLDMLEISFHRANQSQQVQLIIIQIFGRIGTPKAIDFLWQKLDYPDKNLVEQTLFALGFAKFTAKGVKARVITHMLETEIGYTSWNQAALSEIADTSHTIPLREALTEEIAENFNRIFLLLTLIYDRDSIALVRENVESDTSEGKVYAIELMDVFISKNLKPILFPLLDDISVTERVNLLQGYFPRKKFDSIQILENIISSDFNHLNRWTKACALHALAHTIQAPVNNNLLAHIFNSDELLRETAAFAVRRKDKSAYQQVSSRINEQLRRNLDRVFEPIVYEKKKERDLKINLLIDKTIFLRNISEFKQIPGIVLAEMAKNLKLLQIKADETQQIPPEDSGNLFMLFKGELMLLDKHEAVYVLHENELFSEIIAQENQNRIEYITATQDSLLYFLDKEFIFQLSAKYQVFAIELGKISKNRSLAPYLFES